MKAYTFEELRNVCREIWDRTNQGEWMIDTEKENRTGEEIQDLVISLIDAGRSLQNIAVVFLAGAGTQSARRSDTEMDEKEERELAERQAEREAEKTIQFPATVEGARA